MNYDPVYLLDLCILAYQLHAQTLVMQPDPYGEQMQVTAKGGKGDGRRQRFLDALKAEVKTNARNYRDLRGIPELRGSFADGWYSNDKLDPTLSRYNRVSPHLPGLVRPSRSAEGWIIYRAPPETITDRITLPFIVSYDPARGPRNTAPNTTLAPSRGYSPSNNPAAKDLLYCFEGGTGACSPTDGAMWSLMGYVLAREDDTSSATPKPYDLFIVFRGSRSGETRFVDSLTGKANPDWVTDLDSIWNTTAAISQLKTHRGFAHATTTMLPTIGGCFNALLTTKKQQPPRSIHVTGHSLGGALATCFASAMTMGTAFVDPSTRTRRFSDWPWQAMSVTTFAAPGAGGERAFVDAYNITVLARNIRLGGDMVPTANFGWLTGADVWFATKDTMFGGGAAHSPDYIRKRLQERLKKYELRDIDYMEPWTTGKTLKDVLKKFGAKGEIPVNSGSTTRNWYGFREGLKLYLTALRDMKDKTKKTPRFLDPERDIISDLIKNIENPIPSVASFDGFFANHFTKFQGLEKFTGETKKGAGGELKKTTPEFIKEWIALVAAEDGCDWNAASVDDFKWYTP